MLWHRYWMKLANDGSGVPTQALYHIPRSYLDETTNSLTLFEAAMPQEINTPALYFSEMVDGPPVDYQENVYRIIDCVF